MEPLPGCPYCTGPMKETGDKIEFKQWEHDSQANMSLEGRASVLRCTNMLCQAEVSVINTPLAIDTTEEPA